MKGKGKSFIQISFQGREPRGNGGLPEPRDVAAKIIFTAPLMLKILISKSVEGWYYTFV